MLPVPLTCPCFLLKCNAALPVVPVTGGASPGSLLPARGQQSLAACRTCFFLIVKNPNLIQEIFFFPLEPPEQAPKMLLLMPGWAADRHTDRECVSQAGPGLGGLLPCHQGPFPRTSAGAVGNVPTLPQPRAEQPPNFSVTAPAQALLHLG